MPTVTETPGPNTNNDKYDQAALDPTVLSRVLTRVSYVGDCWIWTGSLNDRGYAVITTNGKTLYAHRLTHRIVRGPLEPRMVLDHLCRTPSCVNPMHTELVTAAENNHRGNTNEHKTHCPSGHPYSYENTRVRTDSAGRTRRYCKACNIARAAEWRKRKSVALAETLRDVQ